MKPSSPTASQVMQGRRVAGLSQRASASLIYVSRRAWQTYEDGTVKMKLGLWELYQFKTGQLWGSLPPVTVGKRTTLRQGRPENLTPFKAKSQE